MLDTRPFDVPRFLARMPLFSDLSPQELERLAGGCHLRRFQRGDMVLHIGDPCDAFHVVVVGQVKLFVLSPAGQEKVIELIGPGASFAEALMFLGRPCMVNAQTLADSLLLTVQRRAVIDEVRRDDRFALRMLAGLSRRLHGLESDNSNAFDRAIVIHGADYVDADMAISAGRVGRSLGCFAFEQGEIAAVLDLLGPGRLLYAAGQTA